MNEMIQIFSHPMFRHRFQIENVKPTDDEDTITATIAGRSVSITVTDIPSPPT